MPWKFVATRFYECLGILGWEGGVWKLSHHRNIILLNATQERANELVWVHKEEVEVITDQLHKIRCLSQAHTHKQSVQKETRGSTYFNKHEKCIHDSPKLYLSKISSRNKFANFFVL